MQCCKGTLYLYFNGILSFFRLFFFDMKKPFLLFLNILFLFGIGAPSSLGASEREEALKALKKLPEGKITLKVVVQKGIESADSFQKILNLEKKSLSLKQSSEAPLDPLLVLSYQDLNNQNESVSIYSPSKLVTQSTDLSFKKYFSSGTQFEAGIVQNLGSYHFDFPSPSAFDYKEYQLKVGLSQSLWKDFFGQSTRWQIKALQKEAEALRGELVDAISDWFLSMAHLFYNAYLAQVNAQLAQNNVKLKQRLYQITQLKKKRGTAELPDVLQAENALSLAQAQLTDARSALFNEWARLVVGLKFPASWLKLDPLEVPLGLDDPSARALKACESLSKEEVAQSNVKLKKIRKRLKGRELQLLSAKDQLKPDLRLQVSAAYNAVDSLSLDNALEELKDFSHPNLVVGLSLTWPLGRHQQKAKYLQELSSRDQALFDMKIAEDELAVNWISHCRSLKEDFKKVKQLKQSVDRQKLRVRLEEKRFRLGQIPLQNVIMAGDEARQTQSVYYRSLMAVKENSWSILKMSSDLDKEIEGLVCQKLGQRNCLSF
ncbi:MAG: TolC family protein [Bdellovibrio sp.]|nr:MAG: TolC family protein [Bdellovibrio sp.]